MKAAIYDPYWDTLGGGELYALSFARVLHDKGYETFIEWKDEQIKEKLKNKFGVNTDFLKLTDDIKRGEGYDIVFWFSDGSVPLLHSRHNFLHFQVPFKGVGGSSLLNRKKFFRIERIICNSEFTKKIIDREYGVNGDVLYPPVNIDKFKPLKKENVILSVSRFSQLTQSKRQDVLVKTFRKMVNKGLEGWKLILAGGTEVGADKYVSELKEMIAGYPIEIIENPDFASLVKLYGKAKIFWTASGYGIDELAEPKRVEHFGIAVVEAMASGCVPVVYAAGGHKESIIDGVNGRLWNTKRKLRRITMALIEDPKQLKNMVNNAKRDSLRFGYDRFKKQVESYI